MPCGETLFEYCAVICRGTYALRAWTCTDERLPELRRRLVVVARRNVSAIWTVIFSWICSRFAKASTGRASFQIPPTPCCGKYSTCPRPLIGAISFSQYL